MKFERIELRHLGMPLVSAFQTSFGVETQRDCILVMIYADGLVGLGECVASQTPGYSYESVWTAWEMMERFLAPPVLSMKAADVGSYREAIRQYKGFPMARAGIEMALWDLAGKQAESSLSNLLGGDKRTVAVGVSVGIQPTTPNLLEKVGEYVDSGYRRVKLKIEPGRDVGDVDAVRKAFPDLDLQVDANSAYSLDEVDTFKSLDEYELLMIEQPLGEDDLVDHSRLQKQIQTPICLDESILSVEHARKALDIGACGIINIKAGRVGGLEEARTIHDWCFGRDIPVWCGGMLETGVGRAANLALASLPGFTLPGDISATQRYYANDITQEIFELNSDSTITVPQGSGLGVSLNHEQVGAYTLRQLVLD